MELLVSTVLALVVMFGVVSAFALIGQGVSDSRSTLEMSAQLREVAAVLKNDVGSVTAVMRPPRSPETGEGYFEYTEGPIGPVLRPDVVAQNNDTGKPDTTAGDIDDILMFTVRSRTEPFVGRFNGASVESSDAEIAWFVRGRTLYRRVLLVAPALPVAAQPPAGFYAANDISVRIDKDTGVFAANTLADLTKPENRFAHRPQHLVTLNTYASCFPFHPHFYVDYTGAKFTNPKYVNDYTDASLPLRASGSWGPGSRPPYVGLMLPTLRECSWPASVAGADLPPLNLAPGGTFDAWQNPHPWQGVEAVSGNLSDRLGPRVAEDVVLNNLIGFDVKAWDPGAPVLLSAGQVLLPGDPGYINAMINYVNLGPKQSLTVDPHPISYGAYVDLNYLCLLGPDLGSSIPIAGQMPYYVDNLRPPGVPLPQFGWAGDRRSLTRGTAPFTNPTANPPVLRLAVYDTWSTHYEKDGKKQNIDHYSDGNWPADAGTNGFDDNGDGVVDDPDERDAPPPYAVPLRGIQVKIRVFEPDSRQIREVTIVQEFVTK